ncbi:IS110 family transposase [Thermaerobacter marianensis]|uniref:IS110 family transposase n=1 Tax=Thermaerobacter marianensis TaxID=73919 RepID=UPI003BF984CD
MDVGRRRHRAAILPIGRAMHGWEHAPVLAFTADTDGFREFFDALHAAGATPANTVCALEPTGGYSSQPIFQALKHHGFEVLWVKNQAVHDLRETLYGRRSKTDAEDARLIARLLYLREAIGQEYAFQVAHTGSAPYRNLRLLVELRWKQVQAHRRASNQLMQVLDVLFPEMRQIFRKGTTRPTPLHLLRRFSTVQAIAAASEQDLRHVLVNEARSLRHQTAVSELRRLAQTSVGAREGRDVLELAQGWLIQQLHDLQDSLVDLEARIKAAVEEFPETSILRTFPSMSARRIATLLAGMGAPIDAFPNDRALRKQWGWYVEIEQSGARTRSRLGRGGYRGTRRELYLMAMQLIKEQTQDNPFRHYYRRLLRGNPTPKVPKVALGHVASKLITVMYVCMRRREPYDPAKLWRHMGVKTTA